MNQKVSDLDLATLEHVQKMLHKEWVRYLHQREEANTDRFASRAQAKLLAISKVENEITSLIWELEDALQEA